MRWLSLIALLLALALPAQARFDFGFETSPNGRYRVEHPDNVVVLKCGSRILWKRPFPLDQPIQLEVSDLGIVCVEQSRTTLFLDKSGEILVSSAAGNWGWFSRDGSRYLGYPPGQRGAKQLTLGRGAQLQPVNDQTLMEEMLNPACHISYILSDFAGRGVEPPEARLGHLDPQVARAWRSRQGLYASPRAFWRQVLREPDLYLSGTGRIFLQTRGLVGRQATAEVLESLPQSQLDCALQEILQANPADLGPLRAPLERIAARPDWTGSQAILVLLQGEGLRACLPYLQLKQGRRVVLEKLLEQRESSSIPLLLQFLRQNPQDEWVIQALRYQCRVGIDADLDKWRNWCTRPTHSLDERLALQSRRQLRGFLLASWQGQLIQADFAHVPRLVQIAEHRFDSAGYHRQELLREQYRSRLSQGNWSYFELLPGGQGWLATKVEEVCLLDLDGRRRTPNRRILMPEVASPSGAYLSSQCNGTVCLVAMASGREIPLPESGPRTVAFSSGEREVAVAGPDSLRVYGLPAGQLLREVPFARSLPEFSSQLQWQGSQLRLQQGRYDYLFHCNGLPTREALAPQWQRLLAELWTGHRLQGGLALRLTPTEWQARRTRWEAQFGPGWEN